MVAVGADIGVASIQTSGAICVGSGVDEALCNYREHFDSMLALFLAYSMAMHVGGFVKGLKSVEMWQNWLFACLQISNCEEDSSNPIVASVVTLKYLVLMS